ncbi:MAG: hypothetical protein IMZ50_07300 [Candidatus Atribacteria bacterium]|nr:hypothetical protein [Candidatus Atribacteria bacterium]
MLDEGNDLNTMETPDAPPPEEKSNRIFRIVGGILAGLVFLTLVCMAIYFLVLRPRSNAQSNAEQATIQAGNTQAVQLLTSTAQAALRTATLPPTPLPLRTGTSVPRTPTVSSTSVIAIPLNSPAATATTDPATLAAMQTQQALQMTSTPVIALNSPAATATTDPATLAAIQTQQAYHMTSTAAAAQGMPATGFFDEVGLPSMIILALALVAVIFLARRMRKTPEK